MVAPVISFIGWSGSGKTTFIEKLIPVLREKGLRVAVIKHDGHDFDIDRVGKDTWRFTKAGAECVAIANCCHAAIMDQRSLDFNEISERVGSVDLIITEGWELNGVPKIEIVRNEVELRCKNKTDLIALVSEYMSLPGIPTFSLEAYDEVAKFIVEHFTKRDECWLPYAQQRAFGEPNAEEVTLTVGDNKITLLPFVQNILKSVCMGVISNLKDVQFSSDSDITITIRNSWRNNEN